MKRRRRSSKSSGAGFLLLLIVGAVFAAITTCVNTVGSAFDGLAPQGPKRTVTKPPATATATAMTTITARPSKTAGSTRTPTRTPRTYTVTVKPTATQRPPIRWSATPTPVSRSITIPIDTATAASVVVPTLAPTDAPLTAVPTPVPQRPNYDNNGDGKVTCADFSTQAQAQEAYYAGYTNLDGNDNDGRACESLP